MSDRDRRPHRWPTLDYELPDELIAQTPAEPRDASRLLVARRATGATRRPRLRRAAVAAARRRRAGAQRHAGVPGAQLLPPRDRRAHRGAVPVRRCTAPSPAGERWEALLRGRPRREEVLESEVLGPDWPLRCIEPLGDGRWVVESLAASPVLELLAGAAGHAAAAVHHDAARRPRALPDHVRARARLGRRADGRPALHAGAWTRRCAAAGVTVESVTLHVGLGTFKPLQEGPLEAVTLHRESFEVEAAVWARLCEARRDGRRIVAVGTTSMRVLEHLALAGTPPDGAERHPRARRASSSGRASRSAWSTAS